MPGLRILGDPADRISVLTFVIEGLESQAIEQALDRDGIAVRAGNMAAAPLVRRLGAEKAVRASFMFYNLFQEADALAASLHRIAGVPVHRPSTSSGLADR